jgi:hypothetical protein
MILSDGEIAAALDYGHICVHPRPDRSLWTSTAGDARSLNPRVPGSTSAPMAAFLTRGEQGSAMDPHFSLT